MVHSDTVHSDYADSHNLREERIRFPNYCEEETCIWHWKNGGGRVKDVGLCLKTWAMREHVGLLPWEDPQCPYYHTQDLRSGMIHADSVYSDWSDRT